MRIKERKKEEKVASVTLRTVSDFFFLPSLDMKKIVQADEGGGRLQLVHI